MNTTLKLLAAALMSVGLVACAGSPQTYSAGHSKFTTGISAPSVTGVDAAAREARNDKRR